jgi:uncharacterized membrane protein
MSRPTIPLNNKKVTKSSATAVKKISLIAYIGFFAVGFVLSSAVFMMLQTQVSLSSQLVTLLSIMVGAYIAVLKFIKHQRRTLSVSEMNRLTLGSVTAVWLLTAIYLLGLWVLLFDAISREVLLEMTAQQPLPLLSALILMLVMTAVSARLGIWVFNRLLAPK